MQLQLKLEADLVVVKQQGHFLSGGSFQGDIYGNLEDVGPAEGDPLGNSEVNRFVNELGVFYGEVPGVTLGVA